MFVLDLVFFVVLVAVAVAGAELVRMTVRRSLVQPVTLRRPVTLRQPATTAEPVSVPVELD